MRGSASGGDTMLTGAMFLKRAMVLGALALSTSALTGAAHAAPAGAGPSCTTEQYSWTGSAAFDATTPAFDTGVIVPVVFGTDLTVVGVSADGLTAAGEARAMGVTVGGVPASAGATVPGGLVAVLGDGAPAQLSNVMVVIDRCAQVQSLAPGDITGGSSGSTGGSGRLPHTGATIELSGTLLGSLAVAAGTALMVAGRRRVLR